MKNHFSIALLAAAALAVWLPIRSFGQTAPPNDNFTNRIVLSGPDVTFPGTVAGAKIESTFELLAYTNQPFNFVPTRSVWWEWTAPASTVLNLQVANYSILPGRADGLAVYQATNPGSLPDHSLGAALGSMVIAGGSLYGGTVSNQTLSVPVLAGATYQIQLAGSSASGNVNYTLHLLATNTPLIHSHPLSQLVCSNECTLFFVEASGVRPLAYQWLFAGTNLPGETAPMLVLTNIAASQAGAYTVIVSNSWGALVSEPAVLEVGSSKLPPPLTALGLRSNSLAFVLNGQTYRDYALQTSSNLLNWTTTDEFFYSNSPFMLSITNNRIRQFARVLPYTMLYPDPYSGARTEICVVNLRQVRVAKALFQRATGGSSTGTPVLSDLLPFFPHQTAPICPNDPGEWFLSSYTVGNIQTYPVCLILPGTHLLSHTLPDQRRPPW